MARYKVFDRDDAVAPKFSSRWYWLASLYAMYFCAGGDYCRIDDSHHGKSLLEWGRACN